MAAGAPHCSPEEWLLLRPHPLDRTGLRATGLLSPAEQVLCHGYSHCSWILLPEHHVLERRLAKDSLHAPRLLAPIFRSEESSRSNSDTGKEGMHGPRILPGLGTYRSVSCHEKPTYGNNLVRTRILLARGRPAGQLLAEPPFVPPSGLPPRAVHHIREL